MARDVSLFAEVKLDASELLDELKTEELRHELAQRYEEIPEDLHDQIKRAPLSDVPLIIERYMRPKWRDVAYCTRDYCEAMGITKS